MVYPAVFLLFGVSLAMNPCADVSKYVSDATAWANETDSQTCEYWTAMVEDFTASEETCGAVVTIDGSPVTRSLVVEYYAPLCCGGTASVCADYLFNPCADASKYGVSIKPTGDEADAPTCQQITSMMSAFTPSAETCSEQIPIGGSMLSRNYMLGIVMPSCCEGTPHICSAFDFNPCADTSKFDGDITALSGEYDTSCWEWKVSMQPFEPTPEGCSAHHGTVGGVEWDRASMVQKMAHCCQGTETICGPEAWADPAATTAGPAATTAAPAATTAAPAATTAAPAATTAAPAATTAAPATDANGTATTAATGAGSADVSHRTRAIGAGGIAALLAMLGLAQM